MNATLDNFWKSLTIGEAQQSGNIAVLPVFSSLEQGPEYYALKEALDSQTMTVTEVSEGGSVPELKVINSGDLPILILDGEELAGAKQNRVLNVTVLIKEKWESVIPVSCVEQRRWHYSSRNFRESGNMMSARMRDRKSSTVTQNLKMSGSRRSNQGEVWESISEMSRSTGIHSGTDAMQDVYSGVDERLKETVQTINVMPQQRGFIVFINSHPAGFEFISSDRVFRLVHDKLLRSYALDAVIDIRKNGGKMKSADAKKFLKVLMKGSFESFDAVGHGKELRFSSDDIRASALVHAETVINMSALAVGKNGPGPGGGRRGRSPQVPFPRSYWVEPGRFLAGCYPGSVDAQDAERKLSGLLDAGVRCVINLMEPEETDHHGNPFASYDETLRRLAADRGVEVDMVRIPVPDQCVPTRDVMRDILNAIDRAIGNGQPVFVHCWGGKGRTGTVVGCWLARRGIANGDDALRRIQYLRRHDPTAQEPSPENSVQRRMVRSWRHGE
jgi:hypothetical protein